MTNNNRPPIKVPLRQKLTLILLGILFCFFILEAGLRLGGFIILSVQEYKNYLAIKQKGTYRIMCLGESTTQNQYPPYLEEILNRSNIGVKFSVIDKGLNATTTSIMLEQLEANLNKYNPDMVVAMIGINDVGSHMPYKPPSAAKIIHFIRSLKVYNLMRLLWLHITIKAKEAGLSLLKEKKQSTEISRTNTSNPQTEEILKKAITLNPLDDALYVNLGRFYLDLYRYPEAEEALHKAIRINPDNDLAYCVWGRFYLDLYRYPEAEEALRKAIRINPDNDLAYCGLGRFYREQTRYPEAEEALRKAIRINPDNEWAYCLLGIIYLDLYRYPEAEEALRKAIRINPDNDLAYCEWGRFYSSQARYPEAEEALRKAIEINPDNSRTHCAVLLDILVNQNKFPEAEKLFRNNVDSNPKNAYFLSGLGAIYARTGNHELAEKYYREAENLNSNPYAYITIHNYRLLKGILDKKGIRLVCVQYPMRSVEYLRKIFVGEEKPIFVDNKDIFREKVKKEGYGEYFKDMFGVDFGHCTPKGNQLLAENIAKAILREVFGK